MKRRRDIDYQPNPLRGAPDIGPEDIRDFFEPVNRYKYLPTPALSLFSSRNYNAVQKRLCRIRHGGGHLTCEGEDDPELEGVDPTLVKRGPNIRAAVYSKHRRVDPLLTEHGLEPEAFKWMRGPMRHDFAACQCVASLELFAPKYGMEFIKPVKYAERTKVSHPFMYSDLKLSWNGEAYTQEMFNPDWPHFGFKFQGGKTLNVMGFELDRGTETLNPRTLTHSSVVRHLLSYVELDRRNEFQRRFNLSSNFYVIPILTWSEARKQNIMKLAKKTGGEDLFLFGVVPNFARFSQRAAPTDELLRNPLVRANGKPFFLSNPEV